MAVPGAPLHFLIVLPEPPPDLSTRARALADRWRLTPRQAQVLTLLAQGCANKSIAGILECATGTVELHVSAILQKAEVKSRAELVAQFWTQ